MKVKDELPLDVLLRYGFTKIDNEEELKNEEYTIASCDYKYQIGHARRGQFYYLLVNEETRKLIIYATEPDGGGGCIVSPNVLIELFKDGIITES
jgi:hypothetical protein